MKKRGFILMEVLIYLTVTSMLLLCLGLVFLSSLRWYKKVSNDAILREIATTTEDRIMYSMRNVYGVYEVKGLRADKDEDGFSKVHEIGYHEFSESDLVLKTRGLAIGYSENNPYQPAKALYMGKYSYAESSVSKKYQIAYYVDSLKMRLKDDELALKISYLYEGTSRTDVIRIPLPEKNFEIRKEH